MADHTLEITIGKNVARYRNESGMTQAQLAEKIGVSTAFVSRVERGQKTMKVRTLYKVVQVLNVSMDALFCQDIATSHFENIVSLLAAMPKEYLPGIEKMIRVCFDEFSPKKETFMDL